MSTRRRGNPLQDRIADERQSINTSALQIARTYALPLFGALALGIATYACSGDTTATSTRPAVASIRISPDNPTVDIGHSTQLTGTPLDAHGAALTGRTVTWSVPLGAIVSVSATGAVTGLAPGTDTVFAASEGVTQSVVVSVTATNLSIAVVPPTLTLAYQTSAQLVATIRNQFGEALPGTVTWTSETPSVITVSSSGLVFGVTVGVGTVRARFGAYEKAVPVVVGLGLESLNPSGNVTLSGVKDWADVTINTGASVSVSGGATIRSYGPITIDGTLNSIGSPCTAVSLESRSTVTITGLVDLSCGLRIVAIGGFSLRSAVIRTRGRQLYTNDTTLTDASFAIVTTAMAPLGCEFRNAIMTTGAPGSVGGASWEAACRGDVTLVGPTLAQAQDGAVGLDPTNRAGIVRLRATRDIIATSGDVILATGNGAIGFSASADGDAPPAKQSLQTMARAGAGGSVGSSTTPSATVQAAGNIMVVTGGASLTLRIGDGGAGGLANAHGFTGQDAALTTASQDGGEALAYAGVGGSVYAPLIKAGQGFLGDPVRLVGGNGGAGGDAIATGGKGGDGSAPFPWGAIGGGFSAFAGDGGFTLVQSNFGPPSLGGQGGQATVSGGTGGHGATVQCTVPVLAAGGMGGAGGAGQARPGLGGLVFDTQGALAGALGSARLIDAGNGGDGGNGRTAGAGGAAGVESTVHAASSRIVIGRLFNAGQPGAACP